MKTINFVVLILLCGCATNSKNEKTESSSTIIDTPTKANTSLPYLVNGDDGNLYFSWVEKQDDNWAELKYSKREFEGWTEPELIASGNDWFVNWADYPMIAVDSAGNMIAHFLAKSSAGTYSYDVNIVTKKAKETTWSDPVIPHTDRTPTEHGFVTMLPLNNDTFQVAWLDGRYTGGMDHSSAGLGSMTIRTAFIKSDGSISGEYELDNSVCDCCQTTGEVAQKGPVFMYRDKELGMRDISIVRRTSESWTYSGNVNMDGWEIDGCPVNGPRADAFDNNVAVAWFTAANNQPMVKVAFSSNGGEAFDEPIIIDAMQPQGRVDLAMLNEKQAIVSWLTNVDTTSTIMARVVNQNGTMESPFTVSETNESRASGFPQLAVHDKAVYFAWTHLSNEQSTIRMKKIHLQDMNQ
jgi:hypothetical protein